jgi:mono/diheme cytochrome c family protein
MTALALLLLAGWATSDPRIAQGRQIYAQSCLMCHGQDGAGNPEWESEVRPIPFNDCATTAEPAELWESIVRKGGPPHGLSSVMPAFEEALTREEIGAVVAYIRTLCPTADEYPPGDLNFRRLMRTGKAFPEAEWVIRTSDDVGADNRRGDFQIAYENRIGPRFQYEIELPMRYAAREGEGTGVRDVVVSGKQVLHFDVKKREILSGGLGLTLPIGDRSKALGNDVWALSPFLAYGRAWGRTLVQGRAAVALPSDAGKVDRMASYAVGLSRALGPARSAWTPAIEWSGQVNTDTGQHTNSLWLEISKPLNRLGHVIGAGGVQIPLNPRADPVRFEMYLLWDFGDGPLWTGW